MTRLLVVGVSAFAAAVVLTPFAMVVAARTGFVDRPGPLKVHVAAVPYLGGAAVFLALLVGAVPSHAAILGPLGAALALGALDDRFDLPVWGRLVGQAVVGGWVAAIISTRLAAPWGDVAVAGTVMVLMNGVNFLDGLDGLAGGVAAVACVGFAVLLSGGGRDLAVAAAAALGGFLIYNRPPARVYLGDGGAYLLGTALAVLLAWSWTTGARVETSVGGIVVITLPVAEVCFGVVRRVRRRRSFARGDRRHPYDLAVARGWTATTAAAAYVAAEVVLVGIAIGASKAADVAVPIVAGVVGAAMLAILAGIIGALDAGREGRT